MPYPDNNVSLPTYTESPSLHGLRTACMALERELANLSGWAGELGLSGLEGACDSALRYVEDLPGMLVASEPGEDL